MSRHRSFTSAAVPHRSPFWRGLAAVLAWISDRWLPAENPLTIEVLLNQWQQVQRWWHQFLAEHDPGEVQFRGLPLSKQQSVNPSLRTQPISILFRGCPASHSASTPGVQPMQPYTPWYQQRLQSLIARLPLADMDRYSATPGQERQYRGQAF
jgi:hypothetical protein